jgi:lipopolysaccharide transport system ATP-binding protein
MSDPIIKVEGMGKKYIISHESSMRYTALRDVIAKKAKELVQNKVNSLHTREEFWALKDINFEVQPGEAIGIIGRNGAGKSTLLKVLSRITEPTTGRIEINGRIASLLEVGTGFHPELTGRENIFLNGAILGMSRNEIRRKFDEIVDFSGVEKFLDTPVKRYSSGMYVRLAFAVAAHLEPEILVVDEVLAVGDAEFQKKCLGKMDEVSKKDGRTVLFVSHNMAAIKSLCTSGIVLREGTISNMGNINEAISCYLNDQELYSQVKLKDLKNRKGNGWIRFTDIKYEDTNGKIKDTFKVGDQLKINVFFEAGDNADPSLFSRIDIGINDQMNTRVTWLSTNIYQDKIDITKGKITFYIEKLLLNQGVYNVNLYCENSIGIADWITNASKFNVEFHDFYKNGRTVPEKQGCLVTEFKLL